jgi:hydrogenase large subunit
MTAPSASSSDPICRIEAVAVRDPQQVQEFVLHAWYKYPDETNRLHRWDGITEPHFVLGPATKGTKTDIEQLDESAKYSYIKAPRWRNHAMEVGPCPKATKRGGSLRGAPRPLRADRRP